MMRSARPLDAFPLVRTGSLEELRASLACLIAQPVLELVDRRTPLQAVQNHCQLQHVGASYGSYGTGIRFRFPEPTVVSQIFPLRGKADLTVDGTSLTIDSTRSAVISADATSFNMTSDADYERLILLLSPTSLAAKLAAMIGEPVHRPLKFHPGQDFSRRAADLLRANFMFLVRQLSSAAMLPALVLAEFEQLLLVMFLHANRHSYSERLERDSPDTAAWQVRRAEEYIAANWNKPINLEALAAAAEVGTRSLSRRFKQSRGCSPSEFAKQIRLRRARDLLRGEATSVAEVAQACGFASVSHFGREYRRAFGEAPSQTLRRPGSDNSSGC